MLYPIQLNVTGRRCVVVGAGSVAARKAASLAECGAQVVTIAPEAGAAVRAMTGAGQIVFVADAYRAGQLDGAFLVIAATDNGGVNAQVVRDAQARTILVCDASAPGDGDFVSPAVVRRGALTLTASTGGGSPTLAAIVKEELEAAFGAEWEQITEVAGRLRQEIKAAGDEAQRRAAVRRIIGDGRVRELIAQGMLVEAEARARECL